ncbi:hypothetical protein CAI16_13370 [Virgibacillus dokdonensis]|uniref:DUF8208 domain-containing protein n=1 Tax=Virgibacillus dokdonensis TaxID=302167 RepID=A0A3E0WN49_9BACI|nr:hypothetical protein [Virgibacillus dokdonensis]RFA33839.1 hypothetical protein CAI16_13370 [Virgibacillus dokdonensis]
MVKRKIVKGIVGFNMLIMTLFYLNKTNVINAEVDKDKKLEKYEQLESILHISDGWLWNDLVRGFLWGLVKMLVFVNNMMENIVHKVVLFNDFYESPGMEKVMDVIKPLVFGVFVISVVVLGILFMLNKIEKRHEVLMNVLLAVGIIVVIPVLMTEMNKMVGYGLGWMQQTGDQTLAGGIVKSNVADVKYYAENGFRVAGKNNDYIGNESTPPRPIDQDRSKIGTSDYTYGNRLSTDNPSLYIIEKLDLEKEEDEGGYKEWGDELPNISQEILKEKAIPTGNGNAKEIVELRDRQIVTTELGKESYYRYHVNWGVLFFSLIVTSVALAITVIKIGRAVFDLAFHQIFGMFVATTDLTGGQRTKKVLMEIVNTFAVIFIMVVLLKMFIIYSNWVNTLKPDIGSIGVVLMLIAGAWALIDAPDIVQRLMGIDAGLRSGWQAMMGAYAGTKLAGGAAKGAGKVAGGVGKATAGIGSGAKGMFRGMRTKTPKENQQQGGMSKDNDQVKPIPDTNRGNGQRENTSEIPAMGKTPNQGLDREPIPSFGSESSFGNGERSMSPDNNGSSEDGYMKTPGGLLVPHSPGRSENNEGKHAPNAKGSPNAGIEKPRLANLSRSFSTSANKGQPSEHEGLGQGTQAISSSPVNQSIGVGEGQTTNDSVQRAMDTAVGQKIQQQEMGASTSERPSQTENQGLPYGHKEPQFKNTLIGGMPAVRSMKSFATRAENTGFDVGQKIRRAGKITGKGAMQTARAAAHPIEGAKHIGRSSHAKVKQTIGSVRSGVRSGMSKTVGGMRQVTQQIKTPLGQSTPKQLGIRRNHSMHTSRTQGGTPVSTPSPTHGGSFVSGGKQPIQSTDSRRTIQTNHQSQERLNSKTDISQRGNKERESKISLAKNQKEGLRNNEIRNTKRD